MSELFDDGELDDLDEAPMWKTSDGHKMYLHQMSDQHLTNAIKFLERQAEAEHDGLQKSDVAGIFPIYEHLLKETAKRTWP